MSPLNYGVGAPLETKKQERQEEGKERKKLRTRDKCTVGKCRFVRWRDLTLPLAAGRQKKEEKWIQTSERRVCTMIYIYIYREADI